MRRVPHGITTHPPMQRPGNGYGRPAKLPALVRQLSQLKREER